MTKGDRITGKFAWNARRERAARLVAEDRLTNEQIGTEVGITRKQLDVWKNIPAFRERIQEHTALWRKRIREEGLAVIEHRIRTYADDFRATDIILQERGAELVDVAGGKTGFICRDYKGKDADTPVYTFDAALFRERRAIRQQIAEELGQWRDEQPSSAAAGNTPFVVEVARDDEIDGPPVASLPQP